MKLIVEKIKEIISAYPDLIAVEDQGEGNAFSYSELGVYASKIAGKLVRCGVKPNDFVMITLPRNKEYIASMLGVWMAGAAFAPLSDHYPKERIAYIKSDCKASIISMSAFYNRLKTRSLSKRRLQTKKPILLF